MGGIWRHALLTWREQWTNGKSWGLLELVFHFVCMGLIQALVALWCPGTPNKKLGFPTLLVVDCPQKNKKKQPYHIEPCVPEISQFLILFLLGPIDAPAECWCNDQSDNGNSGPWNKYATQRGTEHTQTARLYQTACASEKKLKHQDLTKLFSVSFLTKFVFFHCPSEPHIWTRGVYAPQKEPARKDSRTKSLKCRDVVPGDQLQVLTCSKSLQNYGLSPASWGLALLCPATRQQPTAGLFHLAGWEGIPQSQVTSPIHLLQLPARPVDLCGNLEFQLKKHPSIHPMSNCGCTLANQIHRAESALQLHS